MPVQLLSLIRPRTAKSRLVLISLLASTVLMGLFGLGSYWMTQQRLIAQKQELWDKLQTHLGQPVAKALWVYDIEGLNVLLKTELGGSVAGLKVTDQTGKAITQIGQPMPQGRGRQGADLEVLKMDVPDYQGRRMGRIEVAWSDAGMRRALDDAVWLVLAQVIGVNLVLLAVMGVGVDRLIFRRVHRLQLALDHAASRVTAADIVPISVAGQDEFGAITRSINTIMTRLGEEIEAGRESEEEARASLTSLQNAQAGLVQAEKMASLGSLVAGISHELNTPIGNILLVASMQEDNAIELEKAVVADGLTRSAFISFLEKSKEGAQLLVNSARRAAQLIQNFKQVAVDQTTDQLRDFDLAQQIDEVLSVISHILSKTSIKLEKRLSPDIAMHSYPGPLGQVLTNTVMNAIKHAFDEVTPGTITVTCESRGERACITVADNGKGIAPENIGKIFDPFFTTRMGQGGSGLGLHISHNIVHGPLGGILSVASRRGEGTTFTILIPFKAPV